MLQVTLAFVAGILIGFGLAPFYIRHMVNKGKLPKFLQELGITLPQKGGNDELGGVSASRQG